MDNDKASGLLSAIAGTLSEIEPPVVEIGPLAAPQDVDIFKPKRRTAWDKTAEARCDFSERSGMARRAGLRFVHLWHKSPLGRTLTEIKEDEAMVEFFAENAAALVGDLLGGSLDKGGWCVCTTPKRRHLTRNFATLISMSMAQRLRIPFYEDVALCHSKHRVGAVFTLNVLPKEPNVIVFDDFVTTGSTLRSMADLLSQHDKNILFVTGINNKI